MLFTYILAGWKGTANDARVLQDAQDRYDFKAPSNKYYLVDARYSNSSITMSPYRGVRYHLKEQARVDLKSQTKEELFNLRHASLRNVIERQFEVLKRRFKIIRTTPKFSLSIQTRLVYSLVGLNNFITRNNLDPNLYQTEGDPEAPPADGTLNTLPIESDSPDIDVRRGAIAAKMWADYCRYTAQRGW